MRLSQRLAHWANICTSLGKLGNRIVALGRSSWGAGGRGGASPRSSLPSNPRASVLLFPTGPSSQRQVQNGPSPDEMDIQRR